MSQSFFIPIKFPSLNEVLNWCKSPKGARIYSGQKSKYEEDIHTILIANRIKPVGPAIIHFVWVEENRRRDFDNVTFGQKFILDALKSGGIIEDDSQKYIKKTTHEISEEIDREMPGVFVTLEEL